MLRGELTASNIFIREEESRINDLGFCLKNNQKDEPIKPEVSRRKEIIKIRAEINGIHFPPKTGDKNQLNAEGLALGVSSMC